MNRLTEQVGWYDDAHEFKVFAPKNYGTPDEVDDAAITNRLGEFEEIVFTSDGTPRISLDELRDLVRAKQDGRVVVLPCKVGDTIYRLSTDGAGNIDDDEICSDSIYEFYIDEDGLGISIGPYDGHIGHYTHEGCDTGVWRIYLNPRAAAEAAKGEKE